VNDKNRPLILEHVVHLAFDLSGENQMIFSGINVSSERELQTKETLASNALHVRKLKEEITKRNLPRRDMVILILNIENDIAYKILSLYAPGHPRNRIQGDPFVRALVNRNDIFTLISAFDQKAAVKLLGMPSTAVVVVDREEVEVYPA